MRGGGIASLQHDLVDVMLAQTSLDRLSGCPDWTPSATSDRGGDKGVAFRMGLRGKIDAGLGCMVTAGCVWLVPSASQRRAQLQHFKHGCWRVRV